MLGFVSRQEWGAEPPKRPLTPWRAVTGWIQHWAGVYIAPNLTRDEYARILRNTQAYQMAKPEINDIEYNFIVAPDGTVFEGRGWQYKSGANGNTFWNAHGLAVCYLGGPSKDRATVTPLTDAAQASLHELFREAEARFPVMVEVFPHSAVRVGGTECPGDVLREFILTIGDDDMALSAEDKQWIKDMVRAELQKNVGKTDGVEKRTVFDASYHALKSFFGTWRPPAA